MNDQLSGQAPLPTVTLIIQPVKYLEVLQSFRQLEYRTMTTQRLKLDDSYFMAKH